MDRGSSGPGWVESRHRRIAGAEKTVPSRHRSHGPDPGGPRLSDLLVRSGTARVSLRADRFSTVRGDLGRAQPRRHLTRPRHAPHADSDLNSTITSLNSSTDREASWHRT